MRITEILSFSSPQSTTSAGASATVSPVPYRDDIATLVLKFTGTPPATDAFFELQGSLDGSIWAVLGRYNLNTGASDFRLPAEASTGYVTLAAVVQMMPKMRVVWPAVSGGTLGAALGEW